MPPGAQATSGNRGDRTQMPLCGERRYNICHCEAGTYNGNPCPRIYGFEGILRPWVGDHAWIMRDFFEGIRQGRSRVRCRNDDIRYGKYRALSGMDQPVLTIMLHGHYGILNMPECLVDERWRYSLKEIAAKL
ncbi:hypothetical protein AA0229_0612 [Gluconobacter cerinus NRIC 0229]|nr:hypothetical protein AA0229_0612 [Gluconobacter cerinus NRIC 0229]